MDDISIRVWSEFSGRELSSSYLVLFPFLLGDDEGEVEGDKPSSLSLIGMVMLGVGPLHSKGPHKNLLYNRTIMKNDSMTKNEKGKYPKKIGGSPVGYTTLEQSMKIITKLMLNKKENILVVPNSITTRRWGLLGALTIQL